MFDTVSIGRRIANRRQELQWTRQDLATLLRIEEPMVERWEQGIIMPDINYLPGLAKLLNLSIEEILGHQEGSEIVTQVAEGKTEELVQEQKVSVKEFSNVEAVLRPHQLQEVSRALNDDEKLTELLESIPFLDTNVADRLVQKALQQRLPLDFRHRSVFPHISRGLADTLLLDIIERNEDFKFSHVLPFVSRDGADAAVRALMNNGDNAKLAKLNAIMPFIHREAANELLHYAVVQQIPFEVGGVLPFVSREGANTVVRKLMEQGDNEQLTHLEGIMPFISREVADELLRYVIAHEILFEIRSILPFISRDGADSIVRMLMDQGDNKQFSDLGAILPFVHREVADELLNYATAQGISYDLKSVLPFVHRSGADAVVQACIEKDAANELTELAAILPFVHRSVADELVNYAIARKIPFRVKEVLPFITKELIESIVENALLRE